MRSSRLLAASTLLALSLGATIGATSAGAVAVSPSPTASNSATGSPSTGPSTAPTASGTPSAPTTAPATPTTRPTLPTATPSVDNRCSGGVHHGDLKFTGTGLWGATLVKGGPAQEVSVVFENTTGVDLAKFEASIYITDENEPGPVAWKSDFFDVQVHVPGGDWKPAKLVDRAVNLGAFKLAKGEKLTLGFRIAATQSAPTGAFGGNLGGGSEAFDNVGIPKPASDKKDSCTQYLAYYEGNFKVSDKAGSTSTAATGTPAAAASSPAAGPHLAETGTDSSTLPIALGGAAVLAAGAGTLLVLRRRKAGAHS
ncbi:LPXTG cell wall anchor domain-containing protein [Kitasatospora sp. NBC_01560]|uniref:LAETG motif-containing sortase-dependent surface protein n=1 Tax=Kitasatospora sp. NBC_01560 TaxID=2975965 RepID=UPI00386A1223